jgi:hypothetical protein
VKEKFYFFIFSSCTTNLRTAVPWLTTFLALKSQFDWLMDSSSSTKDQTVADLIEVNLKQTLEKLELFLR